MDSIPKDTLGKVVIYSKETKHKVFVCGGGSKVSPFFANDAYQVGKMLAQSDAAYGQGGETAQDTIMGESWRGYHENGGDSAYFFIREVGAPDLSDAIPSLKGCTYVSDIASLIKAQFLWSDTVIIMPGGTGTFIELLGYIELGYDYEENIPNIILYNKKLADGRHFFDGILEQFTIDRSFGFISSDLISKLFTVVDNMDDLKAAFKEVSRKRQK